jgi:hypothetical protein
MENLDEPRSQSSATTTRLTSQMKITRSRDAAPTGRVNPSTMTIVSMRKNTRPAISAQFRLISSEFTASGGRAPECRPAGRPTTVS